MKSLHNSVEDSLKKLRTDHIDILYVHWVIPYLLAYFCSSLINVRTSGTTRPASRRS